MRRDRRLWLIALLAIQGCASVQTRVEAPAFDPELLSGQAIFGDEVSAGELPEHDILGASDAMRSFMGDIPEGRIEVVRFWRLLRKLRDTGFFDNTYDPTVTLTAAETFDSRIGNCISYTNLFVSLARLARLEVHFQVVPVAHPTWDVTDGLLIRNNHINVTVEGPRFFNHYGTGYTVDFNMVEPDPGARARKVSDRWAASLFYANLSIDALTGDRPREAFAYLRRAIETEPANPDLWINLGALYSRFARHDLALRSYEVAQRLAPGEKILLSGMERSYRALGQVARADQLADRVRRYRLRNPYYHFAVAQTAFDAGEFERSRAAIDRAIRLRKRNGEFHYLKSLVSARMGDERAAAASLRNARRYGSFESLRRQYANAEPVSGG